MKQPQTIKLQPSKKHHKIFILLTLGICYMPLVAHAEIEKVICGNEQQGLIDEYAVPKKIPELTSFVVTVLEVAIPVIIVIFAMIDLIKAITAGKEDEMKKAQGVVIKRLIAGALVFFIFAIVKLLINMVDKNASGIIDCMNCFINNSCKALK